MGKYILEMRNITKTFPGVKALDNVNLKVIPHHIHALIGENGAGKSTLMNILSAVYPHGTYEGDIVVDGEVCVFKSIKDSEAKGIAIIHQELALIPSLSIAENVFLGNEQTDKGLIINWDKTREKTVEMLKKVGLDERTDTKIKDIGLGKQQLVEIVKALAKDVRLLILDEPTAALNDKDSDHLLDLLVDLKAHGITSIIISHKLHEITKVADEITIIRDGATIETLVKGVDDISEERIIKSMVGREIVDRFPKRVSKTGDVFFEVKGWNAYDPLDDTKQMLKDVNFNVKKGEVVGIAGLMGAGRTELAMSLYGKAYGTKITGKIYKNGEQLVINDVSDAIAKGIAYATEDRKTAGLILIDDIKRNITLSSLTSLRKKFVIDDNLEIKVGEEYRKKLNIKSSSILQKTGDLSGGNQQKVVFSKCLFANADLLILDEPTRGIDVGAKAEIYAIVRGLVEQGKTILFFSSELPEILNSCDRIFLLYEGEIKAELQNGIDINSQDIIHIVTGGTAS